MARFWRAFGISGWGLNIPNPHRSVSHWVPRCLIVDISLSHTIRHTHTHAVGLLQTSDQLVAEAATYTRDIHQRPQRDSNPRLQTESDSTANGIVILLFVKVKGNISPRTGHESPKVEWRYSSTLSLITALDGVGGQRHAPAALLPGMTRYPLYST